MEAVGQLAHVANPLTPICLCFHVVHSLPMFACISAIMALLFLSIIARASLMVYSFSSPEAAPSSFSSSLALP